MISALCCLIKDFYPFIGTRFLFKPQTVHCASKCLPGYGFDGQVGGRRAELPVALPNAVFVDVVNAGLGTWKVKPYPLVVV